ncbi:hypothetical protein [Acetobacter orleanensis]|uniref:hypothetical protein n=1 Tax=Acetobacter orleanensis TaxID=104099 RepID=UPI0006624B22|nr:hypothetical protein [Acetobacter orleanensis]PCD79737.1 hypothetical protein CO710_05935 [Acetobacter orleanensis]
MAGVSPASGLRAGAVFCSAATWWVLAARQGVFLVFCPILTQAENHHRADLSIPWAEALQTGCPDGARIRCRPVLRRSTRGLTARGQFSPNLTDRLVYSLLTELRDRRQEEATQQNFCEESYTGRVQRHNSRFYEAVSCSGAYRVPVHRAEPRSPRALHFF